MSLLGFPIDLYMRRQYRADKDRYPYTALKAPYLVISYIMVSNGVIIHESIIVCTSFILLFPRAHRASYLTVDNVIGSRRRIARIAVIGVIDLSNPLLHTLHEVVKQAQTIFVRCFAVRDSGKGYCPVIEQESDV